jgi:hypothetical protein
MLLVGAPGTSANAIKSGATHVFERVGGLWQQSAQLQAPVGTIFGQFGSAVALDGATALIAAAGELGGDGAVHVFERDGPVWWEASVLAQLGGPDHQGLGAALALSGDLAVVGAVTTLGPPGLVFVFGGLAPWADLGGAVPGSLGLPRLEAQGALCGGQQVALLVEQAKPGVALAWLVGLAAEPLPFQGGVLWPAPGLLQIGVADAEGRAGWSAEWPIGQPSMQSLYAQVVIADPQGLALSNALVSITP